MGYRFSDLDVSLGTTSCQLPLTSLAQVTPRTGLRLMFEAIAWISAAHKNWVAVKQLKLSYYIGETLLFTIYTQYSNLI